MPEWFSRVQLKMLVVLADGKSHTREELHACLADEMGPLKNIQPHISAIRKHLRKINQDIVCELNKGTIWYRHVRLLRSAADE